MVAIGFDARAVLRPESGPCRFDRSDFAGIAPLAKSNTPAICIASVDGIGQLVTNCCVR